MAFTDELKDVTEVSDKIVNFLQAVRDNRIADVERMLHSGICSPRGVCVAAHEGLCEMLELLLNAGCDIHTPDMHDIWKRQPIHLAAARGHLSLVCLLIEHGASVNALDGDRQTPLYWAASFGHLSVVECLMEHGATVDITPNDGFSALHAATYMGHLDTCRFLMEHGAEVDRLACDGWGCLHASVCYGHPQLVQLFLKAGVSVNQPTHDQDTALHIAVNTGNLDILSLLLDSGAELEHRNSQGHTPFFESVWRNQYDVSRYLIDMGANVNTLSIHGHSALYIATVRALPRLMHLIVAAGCDLRAERWIHQHRLPVALDEHAPLCQWLLNSASGPQTLASFCRLCIRRCLKCHISEKATQLPLPGKLKRYIDLEDVSYS